MNTLCPKLIKLESWLIVCLSPLLILSVAAFAIFPHAMLNDIDQTDGSVALIIKELVPAPLVSVFSIWATIALSAQWWQALGRLKARDPVFCFSTTGISYCLFERSKHFRWDEFEEILLHRPHFLRLSFKLKSERNTSLANLARRLFFLGTIQPLNEADTRFEFEPILEHLDKYAPKEILHWRLRLKDPAKS